MVTSGERWRVDDQQPAPGKDAAANVAAAFRRAYEANAEIIYRFLYSKVGNRDEAEDLTAQVFTKALHGIDWQRDDVTIRHWLLQVARTTLADHWRAHYRLRTISLDDLLAAGWEGPSATNGDGSASGAAQELVAEILDDLSPRYRTILEHRFLLNYSIRETAQQLQLTEANVKILQLRALKRAAELYARRTAPTGVPVHGES